MNLEDLKEMVLNANQKSPEFINQLNELSALAYLWNHHPYSFLLLERVESRRKVYIANEKSIENNKSIAKFSLRFEYVSRTGSKYYYCNNQEELKSILEHKEFSILPKKYLLSTIKIIEKFNSSNIEFDRRYNAAAIPTTIINNLNP